MGRYGAYEGECLTCHKRIMLGSRCGLHPYDTILWDGVPAGLPHDADMARTTLIDALGIKDAPMTPWLTLHDLARNAAAAIENANSVAARLAREDVDFRP